MSQNVASEANQGAPTAPSNLDEPMKMTVKPTPSVQKNGTPKIVSGKPFLDAHAVGAMSENRSHSVRASYKDKD